MISALVRIVVCSALSSVAAVAAAAQDTATYRNERYGFSLSYPAAVFAPQASAPDNDGRVFVSRDGNARLLAGALANAEGMNLRDYRSFVLQASYGGAQIDYAPVRDTWFVLSGTRDGIMFYERVTFTCGGRIINSWAMLYPVGQRGVYDRIVEQVARSYRITASTCG